MAISSVLKDERMRSWGLIERKWSDRAEIRISISVVHLFRRIADAAKVHKIDKESVEYADNDEENTIKRAR
jgi:hypothetical protein